MPYRYAWLFIVALIAATLFAFWRSYFGILTASPIGFHIHGVTASLWMLLLLAQSWTPHRGQMALHRAMGRTTFVALPLFAAGAMGVVHSMAVGTAGGDPFYALWGAPLAVNDLLVFGAAIWAVGMALRHRRDVRLHSGYMLSTALFLLGPVAGRVINQTVPGLVIRGPQDFPLFGWGVQLSNLVAAALAVWLWRREPRAGRPWAIALGVVLVQIVAFQLAWGSAAAKAALSTLAMVNLPLMMAFGSLAGIASLFIGWNAAVTRGQPRAVSA